MLVDSKSKMQQDLAVQPCLYMQAFRQLANLMAISTVVFATRKSEGNVMLPAGYCSRSSWCACQGSFAGIDGRSCR